jgi:hypothetical protein
MHFLTRLHRTLVSTAMSATALGHSTEPLFRSDPIPLHGSCFCSNVHSSLLGCYPIYYVSMLPVLGWELLSVLCKWD